jgi:hypothetical protein
MTSNVGVYNQVLEFLRLGKSTVTTNSVADQTQTSATVGGNVTSDGGATVTERGVYWSTSQNPETTGTKLPIGSGTGLFSKPLTDLAPNTPYYVKAYAINSQGTAYGDPVSFTTISSGGLVAFFPFNGNFNDESGNGLNLTKYGNPILTKDRKGFANSAYSFNGTTDYFYHERSSILNPTTDFTLNCWIFSSGCDGQQDVIISTLDIPDIGGYQIYLTPLISLDCRGTTASTPIGAVAVTFNSKYQNKWTMVTGIYTSSRVKLYLDGILVGSIPTTGQISYGGTNNFRIGTNPHVSGSARMFKGNIDDVRIYNRALTDQEIASLFNE